MDKIVSVVSLLAALAALGSAIENYFAFSLATRLLLVGAGDVVVLYLTANWLRTGRAVFWPPAPRRPVRKSGALILAALDIVFVGAAWLVVDRSALRVTEIFKAGESVFVMTASDVPVDTVDVDLPDAKKSVCNFLNVSRGETPPLTAAPTDAGEPAGRYHIDNFVRPQRVAIRCKPPHLLSGGVHLPPKTNVEIYNRNEIAGLRRNIAITGVALWIAACLFTWL